MKKILVTGINGFIGHHILKQLIEKDYEITGLVRPGSDLQKIAEYRDKIQLVEINLENVFGLEKYLNQNSFDIIMHIGALRGGRRFPMSSYFLANIKATGKLLDNALKNNSKFIFCSSVGVYGAIPQSVPANDSTPFKRDNYYHITKIECEKMIQEKVKLGLNAVVLRPSITYGEGDYGFPYTLTKLTDKYMMALPMSEVKIHLANVDLITQAFVNACELDLPVGKAYNLADKEPVILKDLFTFIRDGLKKKNYNIMLSDSCFRLSETFFKALKNELWTSRIELISRDWDYNTEDTYADLKLDECHTIPDFQRVIDWYKEQNGHSNC